MEDSTQWRVTGLEIRANGDEPLGVQFLYLLPILCRLSSKVEHRPDKAQTLERYH